MFPRFYNRKLKKYYIPSDDQLICDEILIPFTKNIHRFVSAGSYASLFGEQWKQYKKTQLDSYTGTNISARRLNRCLGDLKDNLSGKLVLEAGCGAGRFTEILLQKGARLVSSDLSSAVEVNVENFPVSENHIIIQADINDMPYPDDTFDVVICLGVIQHTPYPEVTIKNLFALVKKGGSLVIDHYTFTRSRLLRMATLYRKFLRTKPSGFTIPVTQRFVNRYLPLHKRVAKNKFLSILLNRVSPVISYYNSLPELNEQQQREWALLDTHDGLTDWYNHLRSKKQIRVLLESMGADEIWCEYGGNGVEANCKKPG